MAPSSYSYLSCTCSGQCWLSCWDWRLNLLSHFFSSQMNEIWLTCGISCCRLPSWHYCWEGFEPYLRCVGTMSSNWFQASLALLVQWSCSFCAKMSSSFASTLEQTSNFFGHSGLRRSFAASGRCNYHNTSSSTAFPSCQGGFDQLLFSSNCLKVTCFYDAGHSSFCCHLGQLKYVFHEKLEWWVHFSSAEG